MLSAEIVINIRMCAKGHLWIAVFTDVIICVLGFTLIKMIAGAETGLEIAAYAAGGGLGSATAIKLTRGWDS